MTFRMLDLVCLKANQRLKLMYSSESPKGKGRPI